MRFVKEKSSVILTGDIYTEKEVEGAALSFNSLSVELFTYNSAVKKNTRLHSRKARLILECLHILDFENLKKEFEPEEIGLYVNTAQNVLDFDIPDLQSPDEKSIFQHYKEHVQPTYNVKNVTGILPGHICIYHEIHGPSCAITSMPASQIFSKAKLDLDAGAVKCAVVALVNTYDDPLVLLNHQRLAATKTLNEAAGVFILKQNDPMPFQNTSLKKNYYGYLENLITLE